MSEVLAEKLKSNIGKYVRVGNIYGKLCKNNGVYYIDSGEKSLSFKQEKVRAARYYLGSLLIEL